MRPSTLLCAIICTAALLAQAQDGSEWSTAMNAARAARQAGRMNDAKDAYERALRVIGSDTSLAVQKASVIGSRASLLHDLQQTREAEKEYLKALSILRQEPPESVPTHLAIVLTSLAALYVEINQPSKAMKLGLEKLAPTIKEPGLQGNAYGVLGGVAFAKRDDAAAEAFWLRALELSDSVNAQEDSGAVLSNLGLLAARRQDFRSAADYFGRSVTRLEKVLGREHPRCAKAQANLGYALYRLGDFEQAAMWLGTAYKLAVRWYGEENPVTAAVGLDYAAALQKLGRKDDAKVVAKSIRQLPSAAKAALPGRSSIDVVDLRNER